MAYVQTNRQKKGSFALIIIGCYLSFEHKGETERHSAAAAPSPASNIEPLINSDTCWNNGPLSRAQSWIVSALN